MSKRHWVAAIVAGLILVSGSGQAQQSQQQPQGQARTEQDRPADPLGPIRIEIIEDQAAADARKRREEQTDKREIHDLVAQQGMHEATEAMNAATQDMRDYALYSTILVGIGTALLFVTLFLTWQANRAAVAAVTVTREIGEKQLRAYISIPTAIVGDPSKPVVKLNFRNSGQTPAYDIYVWADSRLLRFPLVDDLPPPEHQPRKGVAVLGPGDIHMLSLAYNRGLSPTDLAGVLSGEAAIYVFGEIKYRDAFNGKRFYRFRLMYGGDAGINENGLMSAHEDGNEAN